MDAVSFGAPWHQGGRSAIEYPMIGGRLPTPMFQHVQ